MSYLLIFKGVLCWIKHFFFSNPFESLRKKNRKNKITKEPFQWKIIVWSCFQLFYLEKSFHVYILSIVRHNGKHIYIYEHAYIYTQKIICIYVYSYIYMFSIVLSYWKLFQRQSSTIEDIVPNGSPTYRDINQSHQGHISFWVMGWLACTLQPVCFLQYIEGKKKKKKRERETLHGRGHTH